MNEKTSVDIVEQDTEENQVQPKTTKQKVLSIVYIVINSIFYIFLFMMLLFSVSQIRGKNDDEVKNVFGLGYESVLSDSMYVRTRSGLVIVNQDRFKNTKTSFDKGDLIWVKTVNSKKSKKLKVGNIVTFWDTTSQNPTTNKDGFLNTHRIVDIIYDTDGKISSYVLQGDMYRGSSLEWSYVKSISTEDDIAAYELKSIQGNYSSIQVVSPENVKAIYTGQWKNGGKFINWLSNRKKGFVLIILLAGAFLIFEMFMVIKNIMEIKVRKMGTLSDTERESLKEEMAKSLEEERERIRQELLAEMAAKNNTESEPKAIEAKQEEVESDDSNLEDTVSEATEEKLEDSNDEADIPDEASSENDEKTNE